MSLFWKATIFATIVSSSTPSSSSSVTALLVTAPPSASSFSTLPRLSFLSSKQQQPPGVSSSLSSSSSRRFSSLSDAELLDLISDDAYAMDISSISEGSEKETYIGQGSGVNEGVGVGALSNRLRKIVGKILTWKNRPIYEKLWTIIEDDLLHMVQERVPELSPRRTWFVEKNDNDKDASSSADAKPYSFATADGMCDGTVAAYKGGRIDWLTTCKFFSQSLGFGNMRMDGWTTRDTRAPHMAIHLCIVFNVIFIYISLVPRANLLLDDEYNDYVYGTPKDALGGGKSINDLFVQCVEDKAFKQYVSKSHVVNAFMVSPATLLYTIPYSKKNFNKVRDLSIGYVATWLDMLDEQEGPFLKDIDSKETQAELLRLDVRTRQFCGRDPDTKNVANLFGLETTDKLVRTLWGDPDDKIWSSR